MQNVLLTVIYSSITGCVELKLEPCKMFHLALGKRPSGAENRIFGEKKSWCKEFKGCFDSLFSSYSILVMHISDSKNEVFSQKSKDRWVGVNQKLCNHLLSLQQKWTKKIIEVNSARTVLFQFFAGNKAAFSNI